MLSQSSTVLDARPVRQLPQIFKMVWTCSGKYGAGNEKAR